MSANQLNRIRVQHAFVAFIFIVIGGLMLFGAAGLVVGPVVAALFLPISRIYGETFGDLLAEPEAVTGSG